MNLTKIMISTDIEDIVHLMNSEGILSWKNVDKRPIEQIIVIGNSNANTTS